MSLAILAVGMTGVLALLPVGLDSARQVHAETVASQIVRGAMADFSSNGYVLADFLSITAPANGTFYGQPIFYTQEGVRTNQSSGYFRLDFLKGEGTNTSVSCRYFLKLRWPAPADTNSPLSQSRTFVTDVIRNF